MSEEKSTPEVKQPQGTPTTRVDEGQSQNKEPGDRTLKVEKP